MILFTDTVDMELTFFLKECNGVSIPGLQIRIRVGSGFSRVSGSGFGKRIQIRIQEGKNDPQK
jgi:hypothetical protein